MVGTAVYQVGLRLIEPVEEAQRVEARRADDAAAGGERGEHRRDQAVDVEQRHDVEAAVVGVERRASRRYARPRPPGWRGCSGTIFGPRGGARGVQHAARRRRPRASRPATALPIASPSSLNDAGGSRRRGVDEPQDRDAEPLGDRDRRAGLRPRRRRSPWRRCRQVEVELLRAVGGIERRRGGGRRRPRRRPSPSPARSAARSRPGRRGRCPSAFSFARSQSASSRRPPKVSVGRSGAGSPRPRRDAAGGGPERSRPWRARLLLGEYSDVAGT